MIPLSLPAAVEADFSYVARLRISQDVDSHALDALLVDDNPGGATFAGANGLVTIDGLSGAQLDGDIILVQPDRIERLLRAGSSHNTLLATERCDQLCVMCSQPPKKTHIDRFDLFEQACLLAEPNSVIGISGGEPTLYKDALLGMIERVLSARGDLEFHVLTNAQHFTMEDVPRLRDPLYRRVCWGVPVYASEATLHDRIVGKPGAFARLQESFAVLLLAGAGVELRTVLVQENLEALPQLARFVTAKLRFIDAWSIMQLENIGFAKNRWHELYVDHRLGFEPVATALDHAQLHGIAARLSNFPRCTVPIEYRELAMDSISDWKRKFAPACAGCRDRQACSGFFEWHPDEAMLAGARPL